MADKVKVINTDNSPIQIGFFSHSNQFFFFLHTSSQRKTSRIQTAINLLHEECISRIFVFSRNLGVCVTSLQVHAPFTPFQAVNKVSESRKDAGFYFSLASAKAPATIYKQFIIKVYKKTF